MIARQVLLMGVLFPSVVCSKNFSATFLFYFIFSCKQPSFTSFPSKLKFSVSAI